MTSSVAFLLKKITGIYVFANIDNKPVLAGLFKNIAKKGFFVYGKSYLANPNAYPLDPINLPLLDKEFSTYANKGFFGVILDAGPDQWGRKVYSHINNRPINDEMDALIAASGGGVGSLLFSLSKREPVYKTSHKIKLKELNEISDLINDINNEEPNIDNEVLNILLDGSSLGGARPKVTIIDEHGVWIAKFNKENDLFNQAKVEHIFLEISNSLGINTATSKLIEFNKKSVLLVKRFDRENDYKNHFISFNSIINVNKVPAVESIGHPYSYINLAQITRKISHKPIEDVDEVFKRMVFNILIHNTDDHAKNHGFLYNKEKNSYELSPSYDLVTQLSSLKTQSLIVGYYGREGSLKNILSAAPHFNKTRKEATLIYKEFQREIFKLFNQKAKDYNLTNHDKNILLSLNRYNKRLHKKQI
jgi:serine/threonine-protein kinase HipA